MARNFVSASSQFLESSTVDVSAEPLTLAAWVKVPSLTAATQTIVSITNTSAGVAEGFAIWVTGDGSDVAAATGDNTITPPQAALLGAVSANTWTHVTGVFASSTDRKVYSGGTSGSDTTSASFAGPLDRTNVGANYVFASAGFFFNGDIAEAGIWDATLTEDEILSLQEGFSPLLIRPQNLVSYWPLIGRVSPEIDLVGSNGLTVTGATVADHTRVFNPQPGFVSTAVGVTIQVPLGTFGLTGFPPTITATSDVVINVPVKNVSIAGQAPVVATGVNVVPPAGNLTLTGALPAVGTSAKVEAPAKAFSMAGLAPQVATGASVSVPLKPLTLTSLAPNVGTGVAIAAPIKAYSIAGLAPAVATGASVAVPFKEYLLSSTAPRVIARSWERPAKAQTTWTKIAPKTTVWTKKKGS